MLQRRTLQQEGTLYAHASIWAVEVPPRNHRGIFCELFTFSTIICKLFSGAEYRVVGATFHKRVLQRIAVFLR